MVRVPQSCSQLVARERHKKPPAEAGEEGSREPAASCRSSLGGPPPAHNQPGPPGLEFPQEAPGGSRGTPGCMPSLVPCDVGLNREFPAVIRHGRRGGFHARSPRVSTRGFLDDRFPIQRICKTTVASGFAHLTIRASRQRRWRGHRVAENGRRRGRREDADCLGRGTQGQDTDFRQRRNSCRHRAGTSSSTSLLNAAQ